MPRLVPADPRPLPPTRPHSDDCCRSGCDRCIFELYQEALERYRGELQAWEQRHPADGKKGVSGGRPA